MGLKLLIYVEHEIWGWMSRQTHMLLPNVFQKVYLFSLLNAPNIQKRNVFKFVNR